MLRAQRAPLLDEQAALLEDHDFLWFLQWYAPGMTLSRATAIQGKRAGQTFLTLIDAGQETLLQLYPHETHWSGHQHGGSGLWELIERAYDEWNGLGRTALGSYEVVWQKQQERFALVLHQGEAV